MKKTILLVAGITLFTFKNQAQTIKDADNNVYNTVTIGTQIWMKENLKVTKYNDGTAIPLVTNSSTWANLSTPAYCSYNNTTNTDTINTYGRLYNWYTVNTGKLCPTGWHVPTDAELTALTTFIGGDSVAGGKLKEIGTAHWLSPNTGATNVTNFTALPSGTNLTGGLGFFLIGKAFFLWSSTVYSSDNAWGISLSNDENNLSRGNSSKQYGISVRCLSNSLANKINQIEKNNTLKIYPNPTTNKVTIECTEKENNLYIYNLLGGLVFQQQLYNGINEINVSNLQIGIYIIKLENEHGTIQQKLIKK